MAVDDLGRMLIASFAFIGLCAGIVLDELIALLAVPPNDDDGDHDDEPASSPALAAESGAFVLARHGVDWRRQLIVMGTTALLFALAAARYDNAGDAAIVCAYASVLLVCAATDILAYRVPNVLTYPAIAVAAVLALVMPDANIWSVLAGGALAGGVLFVPAVLTGGNGMGMGDVKLAAFVGLAVGFTYAVPAMLLMSIAGGVIAGFLLLTGIRHKGEAMPYAPFISAGALVVILLQGTAFAAAG